MSEDKQLNSWTNYQKMVLSELERHEEKQDHLQRDLTDLRLLVANMAAVLKNNTESIEKLTSRIKDSELSSASQAYDISILKYKIGMAAAGISTILTFLAQFGMKLLEK